MKIRMATMAAFCSIVSALPQLANANQSITSLSRDQFQTAIADDTGINYQDFDGFTAGTILTDDGDVGYSTSGGQPLVTDYYLTSTTPNGLGATNIGYFQYFDTLTLSFTQPITAFAIDINTFASTDGAYTATLSDGSTVASVADVFPNTSTGEFLGFTASDPFSSVIISGNSEFAYTVDTLEYGQASQVVSAAPEPSSWILLVLGIGGIGVMMRRFKKYGAERGRFTTASYSRSLPLPRQTKAKHRLA